MSREKVKVVEVGARDGLQNEGVTWSPDDRAELIRRLIETGLQHLEGGSFVSPRAIPQMVESEKVFEILKAESQRLSFLVANEKGLDRALAAGVKEIAIFTATSDSFTKKNINQSVSESLKNFRSLANRAISESLRVRGYVSTVFGCPYEGSQKPESCLEIVRELFEMGCFEVSIGDTIGVAHPQQVRDVFALLGSEFDVTKLAGHFHDTRGFALVNIQAALSEGVRVFDSSIGGLGGCPYAEGASGNVATEEVVVLLESLGFETGVSLKGLLEVSKWLETQKNLRLRSKFYLSKPKQLAYDGASWEDQ